MYRKGLCAWSIKCRRGWHVINVVLVHVAEQVELDTSSVHTSVHKVRVHHLLICSRWSRWEEFMAALHSVLTPVEKLCWKNHRSFISNQFLIIHHQFRYRVNKQTIKWVIAFSNNISEAFAWLNWTSTRWLFPYQRLRNCNFSLLWFDERNVLSSKWIFHRDWLTTICNFSI